MNSRPSRKYIANLIAVSLMLSTLSPATLARELLRISKSDGIPGPRIGEYKERIIYELTRRCLLRKAALKTIVHFEADGQGNIVDVSLTSSRLSPAEDAALIKELKAIKFVNAPGKDGGYLELRVNFDIDGPVEPPVASTETPAAGKAVAIDKAYLEEIQSILDEILKPEPPPDRAASSAWMYGNGMHHQTAAEIPEMLKQLLADISDAMRRGELETVKKDLSDVVSQGLALGRPERELLMQSLLHSAKDQTQSGLTDRTAQAELLCQSTQKLIESVPSAASKKWKSELLNVHSAIAFKRGNYKGAESINQEIIQMNQSDPATIKVQVDAYRQMARAAESQSNKAKAIDYHNKAIALLSNQQGPLDAQKITDLSKILEIKLDGNEPVEALKLAREIQVIVDRIPVMKRGNYLDYIDPMQSLEWVVNDFGHFPFPFDYLPPKTVPIADTLYKSFYKMKLKMYHSIDTRVLLSLCTFLLVHKKEAESDALYNQAIDYYKRLSPQYSRSNTSSLTKDYGKALELAGLNERAEKIEKSFDDEREQRSLDTRKKVEENFKARESQKKEHKQTTKVVDERQRLEEKLHEAERNGSDRAGVTKTRLQMFSYLWKDKKYAEARALMEKILASIESVEDLEDMREAFRWPIVQILEEGTTKEDDQLAIKVCDVFEKVALKRYLKYSKEYRASWDNGRYGFPLDIINHFRSGRPDQEAKRMGHRTLPILKRIAEVRQDNRYPNVARIAVLQELALVGRQVQRFTDAVNAQSELVKVREREVEIAQKAMEDARNEKERAKTGLDNKPNSEVGMLASDRYEVNFRSRSEAFRNRRMQFERAQNDLARATVFLAVLYAQAGNHQASRETEDRAIAVTEGKDYVPSTGGDVPFALRALLSVYVKEEKIEEAVRVWRRALVLTAKRSDLSELMWLWESTKELERYYLKIGQSARACEVVKEFIDANVNAAGQNSRTIDWSFKLSDMYLDASLSGDKGVNPTEYQRKSEQVFEDALKALASTSSENSVSQRVSARALQLRYKNMPDEADRLEKKYGKKGAADK